MPTFKNIVWEHAAPGGKVKVYGKQPTTLHHRSTILEALGTASYDGANPRKITILAPASSRDDCGFQQITGPAYWSEEPRLQPVDGVLLTEYGSAVGIPTSDSNTLVLMHSRKVLGVQVGRAGLECFSGSATCSANVVKHAYSFFSEEERSELIAYILCGIAPTHYWNDDERGQKLMQPFRETYGEQVFQGDPQDGKLDMVKIIRCQCVGFGTPPEQVIWDGLDTYSNPDLASHCEQTARDVAEKDYLRNMVFVHHC